MKKIVLFSILLIACNNGWGQSLPNGDFELWHTTSYNNPDSGWYTSNIQSLTAEDSITVWKVPGVVGQAMHIQTAIVGSDTLMAYITNSLQGDPIKGQGGMPYAQKPTALTGFYKCNVKAGDTAGIIVLFKKAGTIIAPPFKLAITGSTAAYTAFTIPLTLS
ncbi:MAG: hypothetical protein H0X33_00215 [Taibaiella sp.]|nr:hypothetical protein [Taibaiella sp.]